MSSLLRNPFLTALGALSLMIAVPMGCAAIVGADDYQVGAVEGAAGTVIGPGGSQVGVAGNDGTGGSDGAGTMGFGGRGGSRLSDASTSDVVVMKEAGVVIPPKDASHGDGGVVVDTGKPITAGSGEAICTTTCAAGLTCMHTSFGPSGLCVARCPNSQSECDATHTCLHGTDPASGFDWSCIKNCAANDVCPTGMTCLHIQDYGVCEPTDWFPTDLGLGDDCIVDSQCTSHQCVNKPNGWCSRPCVPMDYCDGDYVDGRNYYGEFNWCINVLGGYKCAPGCYLDSSDCLNYPGTTCKIATDIDGNDTDVCAF